LRGIEHRRDGIPECLLAVHLQVMQAGLNRIGRGRDATASAGHAEQHGFIAVGPHARSEQSVRFRPVLKNGRAGASPKSTQVLRSFQLMMDESRSAPITRTVSYIRDMMNCWPISSP
jgi:hypothetical protein